MGERVLGSPQPTLAETAHEPRWPLVLLAVVGPILYLVGAWAGAVADGRPLGRVHCFDPGVAEHMTSGRLLAASTMALGAVLLVVVIPWLFGTLALQGVQGKRATAGCWSLAANSVALILVCLLLRGTVGLGRISFLIAWTAWNGALLVLIGRAAWARQCGPPLGDLRRLWRRFGTGMLIGAVVLMVAMVLFRQEFFLQGLNGDGVETFQLARSLQTHFLPYWEMEWVGSFGTDVTNPSLINSYWTCALQLLLGEGELATRLPFWIWWLGIFGVSLHMVQSSKDEQHIRTAIPLALLTFLGTLWYMLYTGWNAYMADPANPGVTDALFTLFLLMAFDCLLHKDLSGWVVMIAMASLVLYAGPVMFVLTAAAAIVWQPVPRRRMVRATLAGFVTASAITVFYLLWGWLDGSLFGWWPTLYADYVDYYFRPIPWISSAMLYGQYFLIGCGCIGLLGLVRPFWRTVSPGDRSEVGWERTVATVTVTYLLIVLIGGIKSLHYLGPLMPMPVILWLRTGLRFSGRPIVQRSISLSMTVALLLCIWVCWPMSRSTFTLNRELGAMTTFQTDSYEEACRWMRVSDGARQFYNSKHLGWYIGQHTWIHYSHLNADPPSPVADEFDVDPAALVVTDAAAPSPEYRLVSEWDGGVKVYCRNPEALRWAVRQRASGGPDRFPPVFQPIAIAPFAQPED